MSTTENRGQFGSKLGFILSAAGSAVGLGNIWKFPGKAYNCGGGAFLLVYIIMVALIGTTVMMAEFTVGRNAHKNALGSFRAISQKWGFAGGLGVLTGFIILCYYCQVGGWTMKYIYAYIAEAKMVYADPTAYFLGMLGANGFPLQGAIIFPLIFLFLTAFILSHGTAGIEKMSKVLMPLLFVLLIGLMIRSCTLPGADAGLTADKAGIDLQAGLAARGAEQLVHPGHLLRCADVEFIQHAAGPLLVQDLALHAAACEQLLGSLHRLLLLGLHHQTLCIKIFGKARNAISCRTHTAILLDAALRDLLPRAGCKTTHTSSNSVSVWHRGAARPARSRVACNTPRSYAQM